MKCVGGSAGCNAFSPQVVQCSNKGSDGYDVQVRIQILILSRNFNTPSENTKF